MRRIMLAICLPIVMAACTAQSVWAPEVEVRQAMYRDSGPTALTLFTVINNRSKQGAHSALMVSGSQRVLFDPAGSFKHRTFPERNDVIYGMSPRVLDYYIDYHARETFHVVITTIEVSPEVAEMALQSVQAYGAVGQAQCAKSISSILRDLPGFGVVGGTFYPKRLAADFAALPGVTTRTVYDDDDDNNKAKLADGL